MNGARIGIAGVGLIGGAIALRARAAGARVAGYDSDPAAAAAALACGALDTLAPDLRSLVHGCETLVIALPVDATQDALRSLVGVSGPHLVIDVASVKASFERFMPLVPNYVGTHPMAGRERGGIAAADARLFEGATWAYLPPADAPLLERVRGFIAAMGARPLAIDGSRHDEIVGLTSHLPQALAVTLGALLAEVARTDGRVTDLCGPGMMSMLRLARSPAALWSPIFAANARPLARRLRSIAQALVVAADGLDRGDSSPLMSYFEPARTVTNSLEQRFSSQSRS